MATIANLPEELMIEILSMLPPESLLRFKSVCKSWYALINHPKFIRKHLSNCNSPQLDRVLLNRHVALECPKPQYTELMENIFSVDPFKSFFDVRLPLDEQSINFEICGHSHGLICLSSTCRDIFLCNPTTREFRQLPPSILLPTEDPDGYYLDQNTVGFGYDSKSKDFKVVRVVDFYGPGYINYSRVEIYDLSKDRWREIESPVCSYASWPPYFQMYNEGTYYWWADVYERFEIILTFDMSEEVFGKISIPEEVEGLNYSERCFGVLNGSIIVINYDVHALDIWEMNKDEFGGFSWSKLLTINDIVFEIRQPLLFVSSDELLIESNERAVILYNIKTQHFKPLSIKGRILNFQATFFVKSLISVEGGMNGFSAN